VYYFLAVVKKAPSIYPKSPLKMNSLTRQNNILNLEGHSLVDLAEEFGTPCYLYCAETLKAQYNLLEQQLTMPNLICYAVKANSNLAVLKILADLHSGFDIVSGGELARVLKAGARPNQIMFSGVGKTSDEIRQALSAGIGCLNVESAQEMDRIHAIATELNIVASIALRINPDINAKTHPYIATGLKEHKFGISYELAPDLLKHANALPNIEIFGLGCHIGSQLNEIDVYETALDKLLQLMKDCPDHPYTFINLGGGFGITYQHEEAMNLTALCEMLNRRFDTLNLKLILEPGRFISAQSGLLLTRVEYIKSQEGKHFAIVDAGMNDLIRPALYQAWHNIEPVILRKGPTTIYDVVGPVCESSDFLGLVRLLNIQPGDLLAIKDAGAYGFSMSSNYNSRPRAAEVLIANGAPHLVRRRETIEDLFAHEHIPIY
jgi:diaminopimelate decarboxylase